ncbi:preprotein translocase subunit SecG (plasmid) [Pedobacter sp. BS3]|uniref:preprotein translocase subunit SecG n=1 Tax=Pedobacter sp. BS3 TaxID=2567937 RepID=UPI0011EC13E6|nr:preprotein translocase subunit SecG [Pedobacter sp. BS3]TZF85657.1 preprotein translocase subunit SecG [Pedobacter sp. BS3]
MYILLVILAILVCVLLGLIVLIQNPKGGGLSSGFAGSNNIMGVQRTGDFLEKGTWVLSISLMVLALLINITIPKHSGANNANDEIQKQINKPAAAPILPQTLPGATTDTSKK